MTRLIALLIAVLFAGAMVAAPDAMAQAPKTDKAPAKSSGAAPDKAAAKKAGKLDLNTASETDLKELPGIGDAYAKKIVDNRPYKRKDEIVKKAGVPQATYDKIKDQIIAHQVKETSPSASTGTEKK